MNSTSLKSHIENMRAQIDLFEQKAQQIITNRDEAKKLKAEIHECDTRLAQTSADKYEPIFRGAMVSKRKLNLLLLRDAPYRQQLDRIGKNIRQEVTAICTPLHTELE